MSNRLSAHLVAKRNALLPLALTGGLLADLSTGTVAAKYSRKGELGPVQLLPVTVYSYNDKIILVDLSGVAPGEIELEVVVTVNGQDYYYPDDHTLTVTVLATLSGP